MIYNGFDFNNKTKALCDDALKNCKEQFDIISDIQEYNQQKMLKAFIENRVSEKHFGVSTGYGTYDSGRDALERIYSYVFDAEDALVRHNFVSGTHTLAVALFGILRPGDTMLSVMGRPYDTLHSVIGLNGSDGSLMDFGINYKEVELMPDGSPDYENIEKSIDENIKMVYIQRSIGYTLRPSLKNTDIKKIVEITRKKNKDAVIMLDNCYGEYTEYDSPISMGVDLMAGSLIKNPGGGIAPTGGYIVGKSKYVEKCSYRLTTPGLGKELGATLGHNRSLFMGTYNAPAVTGEALKTAVFAAYIFENLGYEVFPKYNEKRSDIIQAILLKSPEKIIEFCKAIQSRSPVDSMATPIPSDMPGYDNKIIMAAGAFTLGSSIELSADAPIRDPYAVFLQGGTNFAASKIGVLEAVNRLIVK